MKNFYEALSSAATEEELKHLFAKFFKLKLSTKNFIDLYTPQILFEFKLDTPLKNIQVRAACIAQTIYYIRRLKFGNDSRAPSENICVVTKSSAIFFPTKIFSRYYRGNYDWDLVPSSPCKKLVTNLANSEIIREAHVYDLTDAEEERAFVELISNILLEKLDLSAKKEINLRRFIGEFFTPIEFANKAVEYLTRTIGNFCNGEYRIWDMAAGTGNLEFALPPEALKYCYLSTLLPDDADYCHKIFPEATVFQYDYLNDDVNFFGNEIVLENLGVNKKMPARLQNDLKNPALKWIIFINPPYVMASNNQDKNLFDKTGVSKTAVRKIMTLDGLGEASREIFSQFLYRIDLEFGNRNAWLGIFSTLKYINSNNDQKMRDKVFKYKYERGFIFSSRNFEGCKGDFSVGFLIWNLNEHILLEKQKILLDVYNENAEKYAQKIIQPARREEFLSKWINRPPGIKKYPPMSGALNVAYDNKYKADRIGEGFLASLMCKGNDLSNRGYTALLSGPYVSFGALSITARNFEQAMIVHTVRRLPKKLWLNDKDQFLQPTKKLTPEFISDAVIWSLFAPSNQTVSLRNVEYEGEFYRMRNNFFPFLLEEIKNWTCSSPDIRLQIEMAREDRFVAKWIKDHEFSAQAQAVLEAARELYQRFYAQLADLDVRRWKIEAWDAGWYQVRMSLSASLNLEALSAKLLPQIYELGFLRVEVRYF